VTRKELLAVIFAFKTFKQYILGRHFTVRTDHSALQWLRRTPEPMAQLARWLAFYEQYDFDIRHRAGSRHGNADGLSRRPEVTEGSKEVVGAVRMTQRDSEVTEAKTVTGGVTSLVGETLLDVAKEQKADRNIAPVLELRKKSSERRDIQELLPESEEAKRLWSEWHRLEVIEGVLYRRRDKAGKQENDLQLIVPSSMKQDFLRRAHGGMTGGHLGVRRH